MCRLHFVLMSPAWLSGRALASHARGQKFESSSGHQYFQQLTGDAESPVFIRTHFRTHIEVKKTDNDFDHATRVNIPDP